MTKEQFEKIIKHQVNMGLKEKGVFEKDLSHFEYLKLKYEIAVKLLCDFIFNKFIILKFTHLVIGGVYLRSSLIYIF